MMLAEISVKVLVIVLAILSKKCICASIGNTFLMKYRLSVLAILSKSTANNLGTY